MSRSHEGRRFRPSQTIFLISSHTVNYSQDFFFREFAAIDPEDLIFVVDTVVGRIVNKPYMMMNVYRCPRILLSSAISIILFCARVFGESTQVLDLIDELNCEGDALCGPIAVNCSYKPRGDTWLEITNQSNFTQYSSVGSVNASDLPDPLPAPYTLSAQDYAAPANNGTCFSRSPMVPASCTENCTYTPEIFGYQWLLFGELICSGTYPPSDTTTDLSNPTLTPGYVTVTATKQCKDYNYVPPWMGVVTDEWGSKWALQTSQSEMPDDETWASNLDSVVWPEGWTYENVSLATNETHVSYLMGDVCWSFVLRDSNDNAWHMFEYPEEIGTSIFANFDCTPFKLTDVEMIAEEANAPSPESTEPTSTAQSIKVSLAFIAGIMGLLL